MGDKKTLAIKISSENTLREKLQVTDRPKRENDKLKSDHFWSSLC